MKDTEKMMSEQFERRIKELQTTAFFFILGFCYALIGIVLIAMTEIPVGVIWFILLISIVFYTKGMTRIV